MRTSTSSKINSISRRPLRAKLIYKAGSGRLEESPQQLATPQCKGINPFTKEPMTYMAKAAHKMIRVRPI
jgi:hypothetical protein